MAKAIDQDLRERVIDAVLKEGMSRRGAAIRFGVSASTAVKWLQAVSKENRRTPVGTGGHRPSALPDLKEWFEAQLDKSCDLTLEDLCRLLCDQKNISADPSMLSRFFRKSGITFKKNRFCQRTKQA